MIEALYNTGKVDSVQGFEKAVLSREQEFCTYIGFGVAIPHAKSEHVLEPSIAFLKANIDFQYGNAEERAKMLFLLAIPESSSDEHLRILSNLAVKIMDENFRNKLEQENSVDEAFLVLTSD